MHKPTIGVDFHFRKFEIASGDKSISVALQLWDIAGGARMSCRPWGSPAAWPRGGSSAVIAALTLALKKRRMHGSKTPGGGAR